MWTEKGYQIHINSWYGRLGNNILQLCCALFIAQETKSTLQYPKHSFIKNKVFDFRESGQVNCGIVVQNKFFGHDQLFELKKKYTENAQGQLSRKYIYPLLALVPDARWFPNSPKEDFEETLVIHIRSGDAFRIGVNKNYVQPPLAAYIKVLEYQFKSFKLLKHVLIVTEQDNRNPCIMALKQYCDEQGISCFIQRGSLNQDVTTICKARYFITSQSSFSQSLLRCNPYCKVVFHPNIRFPKSPIFPDQVSHCQYTQHIYGLPDYICAKEWTYTPKQLKYMLEYPVDKIQVQIVESVKSAEHENAEDINAIE